MKTSKSLYDGKSLKYEEIIQYDHTNDAGLLTGSINHNLCIVCYGHDDDIPPVNQVIGDDGLCSDCRKDLSQKGKLISSIFSKYPPYIKSKKQNKNPWEILRGGKIIQ